MLAEFKRFDSRIGNYAKTKSVSNAVLNGFFLSKSSENAKTFRLNLELTCAQRKCIHKQLVTTIPQVFSESSIFISRFFPIQVFKTEIFPKATFFR